MVVSFLERVMTLILPCREMLYRKNVNRCGFHIVEFYKKFHPDPNDPDGEHMDLDN